MIFYLFYELSFKDHYFSYTVQFRHQLHFFAFLPHGVPNPWGRLDKPKLDMQRYDNSLIILRLSINLVKLQLHLC